MLFDFALRGQIGYPGWVQIREAGHTGIKKQVICGFPCHWQAMDNDILYEYRYPRSGSLRRPAMLVGDTPIPGKNRSRSFADTPCGVASTQSGTLWVLLLYSRLSCTCAQEKSSSLSQNTVPFYQPHPKQKSAVYCIYSGQPL